MCAHSHPQRRQCPLFPHHRARRRRHLFLTWRSRRQRTPPLAPRSHHTRRHLIPAYTRHHQFPKLTHSRISPLHLSLPVYSSIPCWPRQACNTTCVTTPTSPTSDSHQPFSRSPPPARLSRPYRFASLAFLGAAPFEPIPRCHLGVPSSPSKTFLFACTSISARQSRPTSTMPWARLGRRRLLRRSTGALGMTQLSEGRGSDVLTFWSVTLSPKASYVLSRRTRSGTLLSVKPPHRYHHHHHHHYQPPEAEKDEVYYLLFANKPWSGDAQRSTVILPTSFTPHHHNPPTHQNLTSYIHSPSVHYPLHHIFRAPFLPRSWTHSSSYLFFLCFSILNTIRLSMLPCPSFGPTLLLTRFRLAILKHELRIVLRTLFLDLGRFARSILSFTLGYGILLRTPLRTYIININTHTNIIHGVVRSNDFSRTTHWQWKNCKNNLWGTEQQKVSNTTNILVRNTLY